MKATTQQLEESYKRTKSVWRTAKEFDMCGQSVHERLFRAGKINKMRIFTDREKRYLKENYEKYASRGKLDELAVNMKRTKHYVCRQAKYLGLTHQARKKEWTETHGCSGHPLYPIRTSMVLRCYNKKYPSYKNYGARGITVCDDWRKEPNNFIKWLIANGYKKGLTIDRADNDGNYTPKNCRIVTYKAQMRNKRNNIYIEHNGKNIILGDLAKMNNLKACTVYGRYKRGDRGYDKLSRPVVAAAPDSE